MSRGSALRTLVILLLLAVVAVACGDSSDSAERNQASRTAKRHTLALDATGTATINTLTFTFDDDTKKEEAVALPWNKVVTVPSDGKRHEWKLTADHGPGDVLLVATLDGGFLSQSEGGGTGNGTVSVSGSLKATR